MVGDIFHNFTNISLSSNMIQWNKIKEQRFGVTPIPRLLPCTMSNSSKRSGALGKVRPAQSLLAITTAEFDLGPGLVSECPIK